MNYLYNSLKKSSLVYILIGCTVRYEVHTLYSLSSYVKEWIGYMAKKHSKTWFYETTLPDTRNDLTLYSLKKRDHKVGATTYKSLHLIYLSMEDPTEYEFAMSVFGDYSVWENLCNLSWFKHHHAQMQKELVLKLKARTVKNMINDLNEGKASYNAQKYLADAGYLEGNDKKRGRPSRDELDGALKQAAIDKADTEDDANRIGLMN